MVVVDKQVINNAAQHEQLSVKNPITGAVIGTVPNSSADDVHDAVERGRAAQPAWEALGVKERCKIMRRWSEMVWQDQANLLRTIREETGKPESGAFIEALVIDAVTNYYIQNAPKILRPQTRRSMFPFIQKARLYYKPHGVVGLISPWNYPYLLPMVDLLPALIAGNSIILKPSEVTPYSSTYGIEMLHKAGVPKDVAQVITGDGRTGAALVDYVDMIAFTGSTATGKKVAVRAAERLIPYSLELGGKDPSIILKDANLDLAATGMLRGAFENAGQVCISVERVYVEDGIYNQFVEKIRHYAPQMNVGSGDGFDVHMGSMTNERELLRTEAHIKDAVEKGAEVIFGGKRRPELGPLFFEPTILVNVDHSMDVMRDETFGPILPIMRVSNADEAVRLANDNEYGLSASVFTKDLKLGERLATRIDSGDVSVNRTQMAIGTPSLPTGGHKNSGIGRRNGPEGLLRYTWPQSIVVDNQLGTKPELSLADPMTLKLILGLRKLRQYIPFI